MKLLSINLSGHIQEVEVTPFINNSFQYNYIDGMWIQSTSNNSIRVHRGSIAIIDNYYTLDAYKTFVFSDIPDINNESLENNTIYYIYVNKNEDSFTLTSDNFYKSKYKPVKDCFNKYILFEDFADNRVALYNESFEYRCIGQVYHLSNGEILEFDKSYIGYWESNWSDIKFSPSDIFDLYHGLGQLPKSINLWFKPDLDIDGYSFQDYFYSSSESPSGSKSLFSVRGSGRRKGGRSVLNSPFWFFGSNYGVMIYGGIFSNYINFKAGESIYYFDNNDYEGWFDEGYYKLITKV